MVLGVPREGRLALGGVFRTKTYHGTAKVAPAKIAVEVIIALRIEEGDSMFSIRS